jgi:hypothetical protein
MTRRHRVPPYATAPFDPLAAFDPIEAPASPWCAGDVWLLDAMRVNPPSFIEAVLIVQGVCAALGSTQMPPTIGDLVLTNGGEVRFPPGGVADHRQAATALCRLLDQLVGTQACPMGVWTVRDAARQGGRPFRTPAGVAAARPGLVPAGSQSRLPDYVRDTQRRLAAAAVSGAHAPTPWFLQTR